MTIHIYGENGITVKSAIKLNRQRDAYHRLLHILRNYCTRYNYFKKSCAKPQHFNPKAEYDILLFPCFGKTPRGRNSRVKGETAFGEPDMIISSRYAHHTNFIFEFETGTFAKKLMAQISPLPRTSLAYQLCRFYQLGEKLLNLDIDSIQDKKLGAANSRYSQAYYDFGPTGYYFNYKPKYAKIHHSFECQISKILGKEYYIISVTTDKTTAQANESLNNMLNIINDNDAHYNRSRFIALTYYDIRAIFGGGLQLYLPNPTNGFQEIRL